MGYDKGPDVLVSTLNCLVLLHCNTKGLEKSWLPLSIFSLSQLSCQNNLISSAVPICFCPCCLPEFALAEFLVYSCMLSSNFLLIISPQYLERELRMEGLPFPYSFEVTKDKLVLISKTVIEIPPPQILKCDHSSESYWAVLSCSAVHCAVQGGSNFWVCELPFK